MAKFYLIPLLFVLAFPVRAQLVVENSVHDFGTLQRADEPWADFVVTNHTDKEAVLFRVENPRRTQVLFSKKTIPPRDSAVVRIQYLPESPGPFRVRMKFFSSAWSGYETLEMKGTSTYAASDGIPCPDFSQLPAGRMRPLIVSVRDELAGQPVQNAEIRIYQHGRQVRKGRSDAFGEYADELPIGSYFIAVTQEGRSADTAMVVNAVNDHLLVRLPGMAAEPDVPEEEISAIEEVVQPEDEQDDGYSEEVFVGEDSPVEISDPPGTLSSALYKQSNLVFLVDVSSSMKSNGKLDLLKIAMTDLLSVLRPTDRFALIKYASTTGTIIETKGGLDKAACLEAIAALEAGGETKGAKAINVAGRTAAKHFLPDGHNGIILATDGSFNEGAAQAVKLAKRYHSRDIHLSVLGIRCSNFGEAEMRRLSSAGGGRYVPIESADDAGERLIEEIKLSARKLP